VLVVAAAACSTITPFDRGLSFAQRGQDLAAKEAFDEAIRRSPESAPAYANRGIVRARLGDLDGANEDYTKALALGSRDGDVSRSAPGSQRRPLRAGARRPMRSD